MTVDNGRHCGEGKREKRRRKRRERKRKKERKKNEIKKKRDSACGSRVFGGVGRWGKKERKKRRK